MFRYTQGGYHTASLTLLGDAEVVVEDEEGLVANGVPDGDGEPVRPFMGLYLETGLVVQQGRGEGERRGGEEGRRGGGEEGRRDDGRGRREEEGGPEYN